MEHFDVAIIGLGPAGATLARKLSGKMRVLALDKNVTAAMKGSPNPAAVYWHRMHSVRLFATALRCQWTSSPIRKFSALKRWMSTPH